MGRDVYIYYRFGFIVVVRQQCISIYYHGRFIGYLHDAQCVVNHLAQSKSGVGFTRGRCGEQRRQSGLTLSLVKPQAFPALCHVLWQGRDHPQRRPVFRVRQGQFAGQEVQGLRQNRGRRKGLPPAILAIADNRRSQNLCTMDTQLMRPTRRWS